MFIRAIEDDFNGGYKIGDVFVVYDEWFNDNDGDPRNLKSPGNQDKFVVVDELIKHPKSTNPFLKTVTETRVVKNYHDLPNGLELFMEPRNGEVRIDLESGCYDKQSLAELARILAEISEAM